MELKEFLRLLLTVVPILTGRKTRLKSTTLSDMYLYVLDLLLLEVTFPRKVTGTTTCSTETRRVEELHFFVVVFEIVQFPDKGKNLQTPKKLNPFLLSKFKDKYLSSSTTNLTSGEGESD